MNSPPHLINATEFMQQAKQCTHLVKEGGLLVDLPTLRKILFLSWWLTGNQTNYHIHKRLCDKITDEFEDKGTTLWNILLKIV